MEDQKVAEMYASGMSATEIGREFGCSAHRIYTSLERQGISRRTSGRRRFPPQMEDLIVERYRSGETYEQIAEALDCSTWVVARLAKAAGIQRRKGVERGTVRWNAEQRQAISERLRGEQHPQWKGGRTVEPSGYVLVKATADDSIATAMAQRPNRYVREHRLVMAHHLGRPLRKDETVHHKNGDKADNRIENLELRVGGHGKGATHAHCATCTCFD